MLFHISRTSLDVYGLDQDVLALVGQVLDVRLEAFPDLATARLHPWALCLGILQASAGEFRRGHRRWEQQHGDAKKERASNKAPD